MTDTTMEETPRKATMFEVVRMVLSAFLGIRKRAEHDRIEVTPLQVIMVGVLAAAIFVVTVVSVVQWVTR